MMDRILITGAAGNVGHEVMKSLQKSGHSTVLAARIPENLPSSEKSDAVQFDFNDRTTWDHALEGVNKIFLMRPPAISDVQQYIFPFIDLALSKNVKQIVFLSLQGVQFNPLTPHYKVERYLRKKKAPYTFLRPNFFMQNLSTFYKDDITNHDEIILPASRGRTAFIDVRDIGEVTANVLSTEGHIGNAYTLSGPESLDYFQVAEILSEVLKRKIVYKNPSVMQYVEKLKLQGADDDYIQVQKMLYFVVRHNLSAGISLDLEKLLGHKPTTFRKFARDYSLAWKK